mmetsp:Transcript_9169/g.27456  ORF Transcript_9169/g.27456 Transcript_9169/m.27456 type:complete len:90 (-) Transcript_9169:478-747(-)
MERHLAAAALVEAGHDVLLTDATAVFLKDFLPRLVGAPAELDVLLQRDDWPRTGVGKKKERTHAAQGRGWEDGARRHHTGMLRRGVWWC